MKYDLLLTGGEVIDPSAGLRGVMDVGIAGGKIAAIAPSLAANEARRTISVKGRLVTPGLVDIHAHVFVNAHDMGSHTDDCCRATMRGDQRVSRHYYDLHRLVTAPVGAAAVAPAAKARDRYVRVR